MWVRSRQRKQQDRLRVCRLLAKRPLEVPLLWEEPSVKEALSRIEVSVCVGGWVRGCLVPTLIVNATASCAWLSGGRGLAQRYISSIKPSSLR